jgi:hypothetical protein
MAAGLIRYKARSHFQLLQSGEGVGRETNFTLLIAKLTVIFIRWLIKHLRRSYETAHPYTKS